ncbi:Coenzyme F420 hydrogenase/dehydrogenase, beta subunit C-terminal domain [Bosea beijingensis]|uniref:Coenzyme F420 hydrogenase/dehydrogenase, beta subunit C-terminal domain n=1 Tax=Bosea beijingensis TaxID=3068632 RepID=UPI0027422463|nr:Coenzyme F420 hydrogenase/dehydrogenase, beta subunit C-terminal domain [Bosea sp. REN20]
MLLATVLKANLCSGCGLCAAMLGPSRATMAMTEPGFLRPVLTGAPTPSEDAVIADICPGSRVHLPDGRIDPDFPEWGPLESVATGHAVDTNLRQAASSGGALSAILEHLLLSGQASYVLQVAASEDVPWLNRVMRSTSEGQIRHASGSRYAPSAPLAAIVACLEESRPFVVVGKPCDIAALRAYARHDPRVDRLVVAMIAFMCGGIPSETGIRHLISRMGAAPDDVKAFRFRGNGWPGRTVARTDDGQEFSLSYSQSWGDVLSKHVQLRCKICADGTGMSADIVCADAWYGDDSGYPTFDEQEGRSLVLGRTALGDSIITAARQAGRLATEPLATREIALMQPYQLRRTRLTLSRLLAMRLTGRPATRFSGRSLWPLAARSGLKANIESFLGAMLRAVRGRL